MNAVMQLSTLFARKENDLEAAVAEVILPLAIKRLRQKLVMARSVTIDVNDEAREKGNSVDVDMPIVFGDADEMGNDLNGTDSDVVVRKEKLTLDNYLYKQFAMSEQELLATRSNDVLPNALEAAIDAVARSIEKKLIAVYKDIPQYSGTLDGSAYTVKSVFGAKQKLRSIGAVENGRVILNELAEEGIVEGIPYNAQDDAMRTEGVIGRRYGYDIAASTLLPQHEAGTASANLGLTVEVDTVVGAKSVQVAGIVAGETINDGDIIKIADQVVGTAQGDQVAGGTSITVALRQEIDQVFAAGATVEVYGSHSVNIAMHQSAITAAFRPMKVRSSANGFVVSMTDPESGIPLSIRYWVSPNGRQESWAVECLMGVKYWGLGRAIRMGADA